MLFRSLLDELAECIPSQEDIPKKVEDAEICALCNQFLEMLSKEKRMVFVRRYWYCDSVSDIAKMYHFGESKVKMMLSRTRKELRDYLEKEGVEL